MSTKPATGWTNTDTKRCSDCGHGEGTDGDGRCRFMFVAADPSQVVDTSPTNQCPHYCPRTAGERIARKHLAFADYNKPLSKPGQQLAADIDSAIQQVREQWISYSHGLDWRHGGGDMSALLQMFRNTAIKAHNGFQHEGLWEKCEWIECEDRRKMIDSATTAQAWSDEFPRVEETFYWLRHKQNLAAINVGLLRDGTLLLAEGTTHGKSRRRDFEYLPASPANLEQLAALRTAAQLAMFYFESDPQATAHGREIAAALRNALGLQGEDGK